MELHPDRFFDAAPEVRRVARELYESVRDLPLVCPHGHVPPELLAQNEPFPEPTSLILIPDHYIFRMLYSRGFPLEELGIPARDGTRIETDMRKIWQRFADLYHLFLGTPTRAWLDYQLVHVLGIRTKLDSESAQHVYDSIDERLREPDFLPRALYERFNIEILTTTDGAADSLEHHQAIRESGWNGRVAPCFRPDAVFKLAAPSWPEEIDRLRAASGSDISNFGGFLGALRDRRAFFKSMGATSTDHGAFSPRTNRLAASEIERLFARALAGEANADDEANFEAHMLMEMAVMSVEDGLVMQIHPGSFRNHNRALFARFGPDKGSDIPVATEFTRNLKPLLDEFGSDPRFTLVIFTLDESTLARELAPLAGHYPALRLGPAWWFFDSIEGMTRYRKLTTETAGIYNTAGFNDDTRAFLSIPARHDLCRRVDANWVAGLVSRHLVDPEDAYRMMRALSYDLVRNTYKLN